MAEEVLGPIVLFSSQLYRGNGDVMRWTRLVTNRLEVEAQAHCPKRSGDLWRSIHGSAHPVGPHECEGSISVGTDHWDYVLYGTTGPIMTNLGWAERGLGYWNAFYKVPHLATKGRKAGKTIMLNRAKRGYFMPIPPWGRYSGYWAWQVSGQKPNDFMVKAMRATGRRHRPLSGWKTATSFPLPPR